MAEHGFLGIGGERDAARRTYIHAGVALDAFRRVEDRLGVAIEAALGFFVTRKLVEAEFDLLLAVGQRERFRRLRNDVTLVIYDGAVVRPFVYAHLLRDQIDEGIEPLGEQVLAVT